MAEKTKSILFKTVVIAGVMAIAFFLRTNNLMSDPPDYLTWSAAIYVDEGYKALDARNTILYGSNHWTPYDEYSGHHSTSLIIYDIYFRIFEKFGLKIINIRYFNVAVSMAIIFFMLVTLAFFFNARQLLLFGIAISINVVFLFHSRIALYELPMVLLGVLLMPVLFYFFNSNNLKKIRSKVLYGILLAASAAGISFVGMGVKGSFPIYIGSIITASIFAAAVPIYARKFRIPKIFELKNIFTLGIVSVLIISVVLYVLEAKGGYNIRYLGNPLMLLVKLWFQEMVYLQPNNFTLCVLCAFAIIKILYTKKYVHYNKEKLFEYQIDLFFAVQFVFSFIVVYLSSYSPLRYFLFSEVALLYLAARFVGNYDDELRIIKGNTKLKKSLPGSMAVFITVFYIVSQLVVVLIMLFLDYEHRRLIFDDFYKNAAKGNYFNVSTYVVSIILSIIVPVVYYIAKNYVDVLNFVKKHISGKIMIFLLFEIQLIYLLSWQFNMTYNIRDCMDFIKKLPAEKVIMGDWAPMLAFESDLKIIYSNPYEYRNINNITKIKPDYMVVNSNKKEEDMYNAIVPGLISPQNKIYSFRVQAYDISIYRVDLFNGGRR